MQTKPNYRICTLTYPFANYVVIKIVDSATSCTEFQFFRCRCAFHLVNLSLVKRMSLHIYNRVGVILSYVNLLFIFFSNTDASFSTWLSSLGWLSSLTFIQLKIIQLNLSYICARHSTLIYTSNTSCQMMLNFTLRKWTC